VREGMAKVFIKFLANVKEAVGKESLEINISDGETLENVLHSLSKKFGEHLRNVFFKKDGSLADNLIVFVNGKNVMIEKGLKTKVNDGDHIIIFTPVAGG
jgi:MoaD family protein